MANFIGVMVGILLRILGIVLVTHVEVFGEGFGSNIVFRSVCRSARNLHSDRMG
jgi:hypothetical protein